MAERSDEGARPRKNPTTVERASEREFVVTRTFDAPPRLVYEAWTRPELLRRWWVPQSLGLTMLSCEADVRTGGKYSFVFRHGDGEMEFHGRYLEVVPGERLVWTNEESGDQGSVTTVTFEARGQTTLLTLRDLYPSKEALEAQHGAEEGMAETFAQLDELLAASDAEASNAS
jgi:uncharacterized protein YndB with AHSA1/START domain